MRGHIDADIGGYVYKQRIARQGRERAKEASIGCCSFSRAGTGLSFMTDSPNPALTISKDNELKVCKIFYVYDR